MHLVRRPTLQVVDKNIQEIAPIIWPIQMSNLGDHIRLCVARHVKCYVPTTYKVKECLATGSNSYQIGSLTHDERMRLVGSDNPVRSNSRTAVLI